MSYALKHLKNNKSHGTDMILNEFLKCAEDKMIDIFVYIFNIILETGFFPEDWTKGILRPIYKNKGSRDDPQNYRGISILSCFSKLFTSILNNRITMFLEENKILGDEQAGFRNNFSTTDHLFSMYSIIDILLQKKKRLYVAFLDFEKAFDKVNWAFLWQKMINSEIKGKILRVIQNIYYSAKSCVSVNGETSELYQMSIGIRQGENLSPILFSLFLNDMKMYLDTGNNGLESLSDEAINLYMSDQVINCFLKLFILLYADDSVIFSETPENLQLLLTRAKQYCDKWKLKLNAKKCKIVIFSRGKVRKYPKFYIGEENVEVVSAFVYLGLKLNYNNKMNEALRDLYDRGSRAMFSLLKKSKNINLPIDISVDLFDKTIVSIITYGCEVWGFTNIELIEKLQLKFIKMLLHLKQSTPSMMIYGELGITPLSVKIKTKMLMYWFRLLKNRSENKLSFILYSLLFKQFENGISNNLYLSFIRSTLIEVGQYHLWLSQDTNNVNSILFKAHVKRTLTDLFIQKWHSSVDNDSVYTSYRIFKKEFKQEPYIKLLPKNCVIELFRFRTTNSPLPVNHQRFFGIERHERLCKKCSLGEIGDEFHYLLVCPFFKNERKKLLDKNHYERPNTDKLHRLLNCTMKQPLLKLKHFISLIIKEVKIQEKN